MCGSMCVCFCLQNGNVATYRRGVVSGRGRRLGGGGDGGDGGGGGG